MLIDTARFVYHYTRASTALEFILQNMSLRLGALPDTNDPAEGERWGFVLVGDVLEGNPMTVFETVGQAIRDGHKLVCFSRDVPGTERAGEQAISTTDAIALRGYARDRMWAQYADNHRGVCLFFDRTVLEENFKRALGSKGVLRSGEVEYANGSQRLFEARQINLQEMKRDGASEYLRRHREKHSNALYFLKRTDWGSEWEYRLLILANDPAVEYEYVPIHGALAAICVGDRFSEAYRPCIKAVCDREQIPAHRIVYKSHPIIVPYYSPTAPSPRPHV